MKPSDLNIADSASVFRKFRPLAEHYENEGDSGNTAHPRRGTELSLEQIHRLRKIKDRNAAEYKERLRIVGLLYNQPDDDDF